MRKVYLTVVLSVVLNLLQAGQISFIREDIDFTLKENAFYIDGIYFFRNNTDEYVKTTMFYPYPKDSTYLEPDSIFAYCCEDSSNALVKNDNHGSYFTVMIPPESVVSYNVGYKQPFLGNHVEYILLTTKKWKEEFEEVTYKLKVQSDITIDNFAYKPDSESASGNYRYYLWSKKNFMPDRNFKLQISYD